MVEGMRHAWLMARMPCLTSKKCSKIEQMHEPNFNGSRVHMTRKERRTSVICPDPGELLTIGIRSPMRRAKPWREGRVCLNK